MVHGGYLRLVNYRTVLIFIPTLNNQNRVEREKARTYKYCITGPSASNVMREFCSRICFCEAELIKTIAVTMAKNYSRFCQFQHETIYSQRPRAIFSLLAYLLGKTQLDELKWTNYWTVKHTSKNPMWIQCLRIIKKYRCFSMHCTILIFSPRMWELIKFCSL